MGGSLLPLLVLAAVGAAIYFFRKRGGGAKGAAAGRGASASVAPSSSVGGDSQPLLPPQHTPSDANAATHPHTPKVAAAAGGGGEYAHVPMHESPAGINVDELPLAPPAATSAAGIEDGAALTAHSRGYPTGPTPASVTPAPRMAEPAAPAAPAAPSASAPVAALALPPSAFTQIALPDDFDFGSEDGDNLPALTKAAEPPTTTTAAAAPPPPPQPAQPTESPAAAPALSFAPAPAAPKVGGFMEVSGLMDLFSWHETPAAPKPAAPPAAPKASAPPAAPKASATFAEGTKPPTMVTVPPSSTNANRQPEPLQKFETPKRSSSKSPTRSSSKSPTRPSSTSPNEGVTAKWKPAKAPPPAPTTPPLDLGGLTTMEEFMTSAHTSAPAEQAASSGRGLKNSARRLARSVTSSVLPQKGFVKGVAKRWTEPHLGRAPSNSATHWQGYSGFAPDSPEALELSPERIGPLSFRRRAVVVDDYLTSLQPLEQPVLAPGQASPVQQTPGEPLQQL